jgi:hypothetical protein
MFETVAVTINAGHTCRQMHIFIRRPLFPFFITKNHLGMTEITSLRCRLSNNLKVDFVLFIECRLLICHLRRDQLRVIRYITH